MSDASSNVTMAALPGPWYVKGLDHVELQSATPEVFRLPRRCGSVERKDCTQPGPTSGNLTTPSCR